MHPSDKLLDRAKFLFPRGARTLARHLFDFSRFEQRRRFEQHRALLSDESFDGKEEHPRLGIFKEYFSYHKDYVRACRELDISYRLIDLAADDWLERVNESGCDAFLVWPSPLPLVRKRMFDDRIRFLSEDMGKIVYPSMRELWLYESKLRTRDWLDIQGFPHPKTWVFFNRLDALEFSETCSLPVVFKTETGASASGIYVLRDRGSVKRIVRQAFGKGVGLRSFPLERQRGFACFQEYLPCVKEWRMVRIGDSYFGYRKEPGPNGIHSASHKWSWLDPPRPLLNLLRAITEVGEFTSMDVDVFETEDGRLLVNELQTVFGATTPADQLRVDGKPGRYLYDSSTEKWVFDEGDFSRNAVCNLRVEYLLSKLDQSGLSA